MVKKDAAVESKGKSAAAQSTAEEGFSVVAFLQGTKEELGKVVWPSRQQLISESAAVILMVSLSATLIYLVDRLFGWVSGQVF
ncbi:preprotein translocase subunit SecE [Nodosilinea sp. E11]|uniref:preprotein translocase subunit SecE n=1 Tax=Nodosilinea sp. E11 TaxID=3037479 RepID=UPI0029348F50|nr:preprotein translocase subunit SecE [Nodosilinea sp. E11]WOD38883.1 preprotein translocase subunit SecE [Nodosilinea sp. E11]